MDTKTIHHRININDIKSVTLTAKRWADSVGVTYHSAYVSVLVSSEIANTLNANIYNRPDGEQIWVELVQDTFVCGYGRQYEQTGYTLFREAVDGDLSVLDNTRIGYLFQACDVLSIQYFENLDDVKRKKYL